MISHLCQINILVFSDIEIKQLAVKHIEQMVCDIFKCTEERASPLAHLLHKKTMGNPFFVQQLLISFHQDSLITFDFDQVSFGKTNVLTYVRF